ncbi:MAG: ABC transporter substrate-binding protein [Actinobacteria bacterium]|jgi:iron complex transport system substrate-binding protein|nr:ABC transporter substrate-binding protein [Actinomycetota bacterium]
MKRRLALLLALGLALPMTACGSGSGSAATADEADLPMRIISISPTATETLFALGAGERVVAVDSFSTYPDNTPVTDIEAWSPNIEAIMGYEPDLVVMSSNGDLQAGLESLGVTVVVQDGPASFSDVYGQIETLGAATGLIAEATDLISEMQTEIDEILADAPDASGLSFFHELDNSLYSVTSATFIGEVYSLFALTNVADPADADGLSFGYPQLSDEYLVDADPDLIFLADTLCCAQNAATVAERPGWNTLSAVVNGNVIELNDDVASRWGPRLVEFVAVIAGALRDAGA